MEETKKQNDNSSFKGSVFDYLLILVSWRWFIIINVFIITAIAIGISFLLPKWYSSSATILPPKKQDLLNMVGLPSATIARQLGPLRALGGIGGEPEMYQYLAIIHSRTMYEQIVEEFNLFDVYGISSGFMSDATRALSRNLSTEVNEEGTLTIAIQDREPERAFRMVQFVVEKLDSLNQQMSVREARENRAFIERRLNLNFTELSETEEKLKEFQKKHSLIMIPEQEEGFISAIAELYTAREIAALEFAVLNRTLGPNNPLLRSAAISLEELNKKLENFPDLGLEYLRMYRDFSVQQNLFEVLVPILEQARLEEQRDTPTLLILDTPVLAERHDKPKKAIIAIVFFILSFLISVFVALVSERISRLREENASEYNKLNRIVDMLLNRRR